MSALLLIVSSETSHWAFIVWFTKGLQIEILLKYVTLTHKTFTLYASFKEWGWLFFILVNKFHEKMKTNNLALSFKQHVLCLLNYRIKYKWFT